MKRLLLALALWPLAAAAHDPGLSSATVDFDSREILVQMAFAPAELRALQSPYPDLAARSAELRATQTAIQPTSVEVREVGTDNVEFTLRFPRPAGSAVLHSPLLARLPFGHRQALTLRDPAGATVLTELLSAERDSVVLPALASERRLLLEPPRSPSLRAATVGALAAFAGGFIWLARRRRTDAASVTHR